VIPTLGRAQSLGEVIDALGRQSVEPSQIEVLVVIDAAGPQELPGPTEPGRLDIHVLRAQRAGASGARNTGWRAASAPLILFLDDDIVPTARLVEEHMAWHTSNPEPQTGVLGLVRWSPKVKLTPFMRWLESGIQFDYDRIQGTEVGWQLFYSCNVSVKRELLERVGGFDEKRFPYGYEDLELARRMSGLGFRLLYNPAALGHHLKVETLEGWRRNLRRIALSERRFVSLYPEEPAYFHDRFREAADQPRARGRSAQLARWIPPRFPVLGRLVWHSYDVVCSQRLAPEFLAEWEAAAAELAE
jgi:glycosyltransferase involved in cell wall biosynthesis